MSCLSFSVSLCLSLSLSVSVSLSPCGAVVCVVLCVVLCCVCGVVCGAAWHAEKTSVCRFKTSPCTGTTRTCVTTCGRGAGTHGDVLNPHTEVFWTDTRGRGGEERGVTVSSAYQEKPTKSSHLAPQVHRKKPLDLTHSKFENRSRTTRSRVLQSFALPDEPVHFQQS